MFVCAHMHTEVTHVCTEVWKPEIDVSVFLYSSPLPFLGIESLTDPGDLDCLNRVTREPQGHTCP